MIQDQGPQYTPPNYMPPAQLALQQEYAAALMKGGQRDKEITSPWQGARMMADALAGRHAAAQAGQSQLDNLNLDASKQMGAAPPPGADPGGMPHTPQAPIGPQASLSPGGMTPYDTRTAKLESGGNPNSVTGSNKGLMQMGPEEMRRYGITNWQDPNQQVSGLHQERAANVQGLTKALGRPPTPGEEYLAHQQGLAGATALLTSPNMPAWQAVRKFYPSDAIAQKAIAGNPPGGGHFDPNAPAGAFTGAWVKQFESRLGPQAGAGGQTADLSGSIGGRGSPSAGSPQAMSGALAGGPPGVQMAAGGRAPGPGAGVPPIPQVGNPTFGQEYMPSRPQFNPKILQELLGSPTMDPAVKQQLYQQYMEQNQPVTSKIPGMGTYISPRGGKGPPIFQPDLQKFKEGEYEVPATADERGNVHVRPLQGGAPSGGAGPPDAPPPVWGKFGTPAPAAPLQAPKPGSALEPPPGAPGVASAAPPSGGPSVMSSLPGAPGPSMLSPGAMPPGAPPTQVASLDPTSGVGPAAQAAPPPAQAPKGPQIAQQGQAGPLGPFVDQLKQWEIGNKAQQEGASAQAKGFAEDAEKERVGLNEAATKSATGLSQLQTAKALLDDPNLSAGFLFKARGDLQKARAWLGGNPNAARANEVFDKVIASQTLPELSAQTKQMGQVRLAELQVVQSSLASRALTPEGAKSVLDIMMNAHRLNMDVAELANSFAQGWRLGPDGKPVMSGKKGLNDYEWQPTLQKFLAANPVIPPELRANWEKNFGSNLEEAALKGSTPTGKTTGRPQPMATPVPGFHEAPPPPPGNWQEHR